MARPRFSEMLVTRRHELGLSTAQASRVLKLKEDVLVAFEEGDWEHMPQSGYAQGMLSSYARYLGLNARDVTNLFQEDLYQHLHGMSSHELRRHTRDTQAGRGVVGYDVPNEADSRPKAYVEYRGLLPTSGGPAGDMGDFATTSQVSSRSSVPLVGGGVRQSSSYGQRGSSYSQQQGNPYSHAQYSTGHTYNNTQTAQERYGQQKAAQSTARRRSNQAQQRRRYDDERASAASGASRQQEYQGTGRSYGSRTDSQRAYRRDDVSTRRVASGEYVDDTRYSDRTTESYERASTITGRRASRDIASTERPNVRRRSDPDGRRSGSSQRRRPQRKGPLGAIQNFFSDSGRALFAIIVLLTVVITAIILFASGSCSSSSGSESERETITVSTTDAGSSSEDATSTDDDAEEGTADATAQTTTTDGTTDSEEEEEEVVTETVVEVSVQSGSYSWVEIELDGEIQVAEGITGSWSETYTVTDTITISANNPDVVTVTNNGETETFTSKASGVGTITITAPVSETDATDEDGTDADAAAYAGVSWTSVTGLASA